MGGGKLERGEGGMLIVNSHANMLTMKQEVKKK